MSSSGGKRTTTTTTRAGKERGEDKWTAGGRLCSGAGDLFSSVFAQLVCCDLKRRRPLRQPRSKYIHDQQTRGLQPGTQPADQPPFPGTTSPFQPLESNDSTGLFLDSETFPIQQLLKGVIQEAQCSDSTCLHHHRYYYYCNNNNNRNNKRLVDSGQHRVLSVHRARGRKKKDF